MASGICSSHKRIIGRRVRHANTAAVLRPRPGRLIVARLAEAINLEDAPPSLAQAFADQADWDPRRADDLPASHTGYVFLCLQPERVQVWRHAGEHPGRTVMRESRWVV
jgi:hypothetical protein